ncbi:MAG TPA: 30S ribosomal protein S7 [Patescibacteria group bacterium]|nr:30S ribosomal protein S7 [Patescibacteria group bacterium]
MRHAKIQKRQIKSDTKYNSQVVAKMINYIMIDGKKTVAQDNVYAALELLAQKGNAEAMELFDRALQNVGPKVEVKAKRIGGANYQVPVEVRAERRVALALRWIIEAARKRSNREFHTFAEKLAAELFDATQNIGEAIKKKETAMRQAEANKAFGHFRW